MMEQVSAVAVMINNNNNNNNNNNKLAVRRGEDHAAADDDQDDDFADSSIDYLPPGFRFHPTDEEIITHYLCRKVHNTKFTASAVGEVDLNKCEPWDLPYKAKMGEKEWYFFCQRDRKYPTGTRTNRATDAGYWKATGKDKEIYKGKQQQQQQQEGCLVGMKKTLVFYRGRAPKGEKSNWVMHEYRLEGKFSYYNLPKSAKAEWVVCRVFHKKSTENGMIKKNPYSSCSSSSSSLLRMNSSFGDEELLLMNSPSLPPLVLAAPHHHQNHFNSNTTTTTTTTTAAAAGSTTFMMNNNNINMSIGNDHQQVVLEEDQEFKSMTKSTRFFDNGSTTHPDQLNISYNPTGSIMENNYYNNINYQQQGNPSPNTPHPNSNNYNNNNIFYPQNIPNSPDQFSFHGSSNMGFENNIIPSSTCFPNSYFSNTTDDQAILKALADYEPSSSSYDHQPMIKREEYCKVEPFHSNNQPMAMVSRSQDTGLSTDMNTEISSVITKHEDNLGNNNGSSYEDHLDLDHHVPASSDDPVVDLDSLWDY